MSVETAQTAKRTGGCGCGGAGSGGYGLGGGSGGCGCGGSGGCGCGGGAGCGECGGDVGQHTYVRPRFFAGQLLTNDDLELLGAYVAAKNRLHNRYLFGPGVVCGLEVVCDPCGGGTVKVRPGYALDCCGADIVVACPVSLDVNALIRDLRRHELGVDCGDPCADKDKKPAAGQENAGEESKDKPVPSRHYCLYIRYAETLAEPVAPYVTDEPCGQQGCEPSRVREGFRFVLRCDDHKTPRDDLETRLAACTPKSQSRALAEASERMARYTEPMLRATQPSAMEAPFDADAVAQATAQLAPQPAATGSLTAERARAMTEDVRQLASALARLQLQDDQTRTAILGDQQNEQRIKDARSALTAAVSTLSAAPEDTWTDNLDKETADQLLRQAGQLADANAAPLEPVRARMLAQGLPLGAGVLSVLRDNCDAIRTWLLRQLDAATNLTDCELRAAVAAVTLPATATNTSTPGPAQPPTGTPGLSATPAPALQALRDQTVADTANSCERLTELLQRYLVNCACGAINPPCSSCVDTDVLLACIEVRECEVVRICNIVRNFVLSPAALRYWIPPLNALHDRLEKFCCPKPEINKVTPHGGMPSALVQAFSTEQSATPTVTPRAVGLRDLLFAGDQPGASVTPQATFMATLTRSTAAARDEDEVSVLRAQVEELSRLLDQTRDRLMTEKGRITKLQNRVDKLPRS
jgi:hypothetical protein